MGGKGASAGRSTAGGGTAAEEGAVAKKGDDARRGAAPKKGDDAEPPSDRRLIRGRLTRTSIIEALIALIEAGNPQPNARQIAEAAAVSVRLVFYYFDGVNALFLRAADLHTSRHRYLIGRIPPRGPVSTRLRPMCRQRRELFESIGPVLRAVYAKVLGTAGLEDILIGHRAFLRHQLTVALAAEIDARGSDAPEFLDMLEAVTGWEAWHSYRFGARRSASAAERLMLSTVTALLR